VEKVYVCSVCNKIFRDNRKHFANRRCGFSGMRMEKHFLLTETEVNQRVGGPHLNFGGDIFPDQEGEWQ
jgi:DNA-directed RNA polymerase subunit RPC12/RpoP